MMSSGDPPRLELHGNTLRVSGEIGFDEETALEKALLDLVEAGHDSVVIDLSHVSYITSSSVRLLAVAMVRAGEKACLTTLLVTERVLRLLRIAGIDKLGTIELADGA